MTVEAKWRATRNRQPNFSFMKEGRKLGFKAQGEEKRRKRRRVEGAGTLLGVCSHSRDGRSLINSLLARFLFLFFSGANKRI